MPARLDSLPPNEHFERLALLLNLESEEEARRTLERNRGLSAAQAERAGESLTGLVIVEETSGLGGRCILTFAKKNRTLALPWNRFEPGAPVVVSPR